MSVLLRSWPGASPDVIVLGAGIVGAACALELSRSGLRVVVVDDGIAGGGATAAGMGHITVMDDSEPQFALTRYSQQLWRAMHEGGADAVIPFPAEAEWLPCGTIWVAADDEEMAEVHRKAAFYAERSVPAEVLGAAQLAEAEPNLRHGLAGGLRVSEDSVIYPPATVLWMLRCCQQLGGTMIRQRAVHFDDGGVTLADGSRVAAQFIVHATGTWTPQLLPNVPVHPRKGHLLITERYPGFVRHQLVELGYLKSAASAQGDSVAFNAQPRATGQILIGSSRQYGVTDSGIEPAMLARMLQRAQEFMPGIGQLQGVRAWTGFRASTPDKLPLIGPVSGYRNVYLATGHEGLGITTATGTAKLIAAHLLGRSAAIPPEPYLPSRFEGRNAPSDDAGGAS